MKVYVMGTFPRPEEVTFKLESEEKKNQVHESLEK